MTRLSVLFFVAFAFLLAFSTGSAYGHGPFKTAAQQGNDPVISDEPFVEVGLTDDGVEPPLGAEAPVGLLSPSNFCLQPSELRIITLTNQLRAEQGLPPLVASKTLGAAARDKSKNMADFNYFSHDSPSNAGELSNLSASENIVAHGYPRNAWKGENIAAGNSTADKTFQQWRNSEGHYNNMVRREYKMIGVGYGYNQNARYDHYWTQTFGGVDLGANDVARACSDGPNPTPQPPTPTPQPPTPTPRPPTPSPTPPTPTPTTPDVTPTPTEPASFIIDLDCQLVVVNNQIYDLRCTKPPQ